MNRLGRAVGLASAGSAMVIALLVVPLSVVRGPSVGSQSMVLTHDVATLGFAQTVEFTVDAEMVGFTWDGSTSAAVELRTLGDVGAGEWLSLEGSPLEAPDAASPESVSAESQAAQFVDKVSAGPAWLGHDVRKVEIRVTEGSAPGLAVHAIDTEPPRTTGLALGAEPAAAETPFPRLITRAQWGADETLRTVNCSGNPSYASKVHFAVIHHTVNSNSYGPGDSASLIRGIYYFHVNVNGWCDIGYSFLVDRYGQTFEGRYGGINQPVIGGHAGGFNGGSTGIAMLGDFGSAVVPSAMYASLRSLLAWKLAFHHVNPQGTTTHMVAESDCNCQRWPVGTVVTIPTVVGHGDVDSTSCPGASLYAWLAQLRVDVAADIAHLGPAEFECQWEQTPAAGPGVDAWAPGRIDVFARGADNALYHKAEVGSSISPWQYLGGALTSDPDVTSWAPGRLDVVARGTDGGIWHRAWTGSGWSAWQGLGGAAASAPTITSWGPNRLDIVICAEDGALWHKAWYGSGWTTWIPLGERPTSAPELTSWGSNRLDLFFRGVDGTLRHKAWTGGRWSSSYSLGGQFSTPAGATSWGSGRIDVYARGPGNQVWSIVWNNNTWSAWYPFGGAMASAPDASSWSGRIDMVIQASDRQYWQRVWTTAGWSNWFPIG